MLLGVSYRFTDLTSLFIIHNWINACGRSLKAFLLFILLLIIIPGYLPADVGDTTRVSVASSGAEANNESLNSDISEDGRFVSFESLASNLVANDNNATNDIFVHDRQTGQTQRVSVDSAGVESNGYSTFAAISDDGRYVAFDSAATNLVANDTNSTRDIFVHDRSTGETTRVSIDSAGNEGDSLSITPAISATGRYVAFTSYASNLIAGDTNGLVDIFVHDRDTGETSRVSVAS
ncbi:MAG: hypothetical protein KZQ77_15970, partial [Candidatus Thiodiazotropha sp. (ex Notomyrtea botanica)]|nr:hypothetical protein [Candidatus Thiodiazotropha sp. (ex Notomyrtea botanica)]